MTLERAASRDRARSRPRTDAPFGVNLRADAGDAAERVELLIERGRARSRRSRWRPKQELIARLKDAGVVVMPVGRRRAGTPRRSPAWGADAVMVQGGEGGGHTGTGRRRPCCCRRSSTRSTSR